MASPTAVNIGIGFDIKEMMTNTGLARNELARFTRDVKSSLTDAEKFARDAKVANVLFQKGQIDEATHQRMIAMYRERYKIVDEVAAREAQQQAHQKARLDEYAAHKQAIAQRELERIAVAKKAEEDGMMFMHRLKQTIDADNKARADARISKMLEENRTEVENILRVERERARAQQKFLATVTQDIAVREQADRSAYENHWANINNLITQEANLVAQTRQTTQQRAEQARLAREAVLDQQRLAGRLGTGTYSSAEGHNAAARAAQTQLTVEQMLLGVTQQQAAAEQRRNETIAQRRNMQGPDLSGDWRRIRDEDLAARARNMERIRGMLQAAQTAEEQYAQSVRFVNNMLRWNNITREEAIRLIERERAALQQNAAAAQSQTFMGQFRAGLGMTTAPMLAAQAVLSLVNAIKSFVRESVVLAAEYQRTEAAMKALTGSSEEATKKMIEFRELDKKTPLSFLDFARGAKTLMGFGLEAERTGAIMKSLSAISMGNAERFQSLALAFGQVRASGKLAGQEVLQMVNAGFNPLQEIAKLTGESMAELRQKTTDGQISFEEVALAIELSTEAGGRFATMNEELQLTLAGQYDKYLSDMKMIRVEMGENLMPLMIQLLGIIKDITAANDEQAESYNYLRTASGSLALIVAAMRDIANLQLTIEKSAFNLIFNPLQAVKDWKAWKENSPVKEVLQQIEEAEKEREFRRAAAAAKREEDEAKELERAKKREELGEEGYRRWRLNQAREETEKRNAEKEAEAAAKRENDVINQTQEEYQKLGKTKRELFKESLGYNDENLSGEEARRRTVALEQFDAIERQKEIDRQEENIQKKKIQNLISQNNLLEIQNMLKAKKIDQQDFEAAKDQIRDQAEAVKDRVDPMRKARRDIQAIQNLLAAGLIDEATARAASLEIAKGIKDNVKDAVNKENPRQVKSFADALLIAQDNRKKTQHETKTEDLLARILAELRQQNQNNGVVANVR